MVKAEFFSAPVSVVMLVKVGASLTAFTVRVKVSVLSRLFSSFTFTVITTLPFLLAAGVRVIVLLALPHLLQCWYPVKGFDYLRLPFTTSRQWPRFLHPLR